MPSSIRPPRKVPRTVIAVSTNDGAIRYLRILAKQ
jgi:hypothetical protein